MTRLAETRVLFETSGSKSNISTEHCNSGENNIVHLESAANRLAQHIDRFIRSGGGGDSSRDSGESGLVPIDDFDDDRESVRSNRTLRQSSSISSLDSYMTCWDEFDYSLFQFLHCGIQQAEQGQLSFNYESLKGSIN